MNPMVFWSMIIFQDVISWQYTWKCTFTPGGLCCCSSTRRTCWKMHTHSCICICMTQPAPGCLCVCVFCVCVTVVRTSLVSTTHMPVCSVQWPEWQLRGLGWAAGKVPFMVMTDGSRRDARLLQRTGRKGWGQGKEQNWVREREIESTRGSGKGVIEMERERLRWGWISAALRGRAKEVSKGSAEQKGISRRRRLLHWLGLCLVQLMFHWKVKTETFTCSTGHLCPEPISLQTRFASSPPPTAKKMEGLRNNYFLLSLISKKECRGRGSGGLSSRAQTGMQANKSGSESA